MEIKLLIALDFDIILPSCGNFSDYMISNKTTVPMKNLMYDIMAVIMTNPDWAFTLDQHEIAQSGIEIGLHFNQLNTSRCFRQLTTNRKIGLRELLDYLLKYQHVNIPLLTDVYKKIAMYTEREY